MLALRLLLLLRLFRDGEGVEEGESCGQLGGEEMAEEVGLGGLWIRGMGKQATRSCYTGSLGQQ